MGRELQKKKNRSSLPKVRQKAHKRKNKASIRGNPIITSQWKRNETLTQNYRRLGLTARLNGATGGIERRVGDVVESELRKKQQQQQQRMVDEVRVERDEHGAIVKVIRSEGLQEKKNPLGDMLNDLEDDDEEEEEGNGQRMATTTTTTTRGGGVIEELERFAKRPTLPVVRKQSVREEEWIRALVDKYGDDYRAMFWDGKLNPWQQSEGDIKRRVLRWKKRRRQEEEVG